MKQYDIGAGHRFPFGVTRYGDGTNFSIWGLRSTSAELLLFENAESRTPFQIITLDPVKNRTYYSWHVFVYGLPPGVLYAWRLDGPATEQRKALPY